MGAFQGKELVGITAFSANEKEKTKHIATILQVFVEPKMQGKGIGKNLMIETVSEGFKNPEIEQILLGVICGNQNAEKIYRDLGFQEYGLQKNYLKTEDGYLDHLLMVLTRENFNTGF